MRPYNSITQAREDHHTFQQAMLKACTDMGNLSVDALLSNLRENVDPFFSKQNISNVNYLKRDVMQPSTEVAILSRPIIYLEGAAHSVGSLKRPLPSHCPPQTLSAFKRPEIEKSSSV